jgi:hypothetical protein
MSAKLLTMKIYVPPTPPNVAKWKIVSIKRTIVFHTNPHKVAKGWEVQPFQTADTLPHFTKILFNPGDASSGSLTIFLCRNISFLDFTKQRTGTYLKGLSDEIKWSYDDSAVWLGTFHASAEWFYVQY